MAHLTGLRQQCCLHLVLTGPGGGTGTCRSATRGRSCAGHRHRCCRVLPAVANRVTPADLDLDVTGDPGHVAAVLAAAAALALD